MKKLLIFVFICITVFCCFYYIFLKLGNNRISNEKGIDDIIKKCLNYEAEIDVIINSNKTQNNYKMKQIVKDNYSKLQIIEPQNISGLSIEKDNNTLKVTNSILNVEKCYEHQQELLNNHLFLNVFIKDLEEYGSTIKETDSEIIVEVKLESSQNTYVKSKRLIINKKPREIKELVIKDNTNKTIMSIKYNNLII